MSNYKKVKEKKFRDFLSSYPNRLSINCFMDYKCYSDLEHGYDYIVAKIFDYPPEKRYYIRKNIRYFYTCEICKRDYYLTKRAEPFICKKCNNGKI